MSHEIYDLAHSPCRHNSFICVKLCSSIDAASLGEVFCRREFIVRAHIAAQIFYFLLWLTVSCLSTSAWEFVVRLICIFVHPSGAILFFFFCGQHIRHSYLIGSCWEDCGYGAPADWIFVGMGKQPFLRIRFSLMQSMGEHGSKENTQWVVWVELLPSQISGRTSPGTIFFSSPKWRRADKVLSWFFAWSHLHSLSVHFCSGWLWCPFPLIFLVLVGF